MEEKRERKRKREGGKAICCFSLGINYTVLRGRYSVNSWPFYWGLDYYIITAVSHTHISLSLSRSLYLSLFLHLFSCSSFYLHSIYNLQCGVGLKPSITNLPSHGTLRSLLLCRSPLFSLSLLLHHHAILYIIPLCSLQWEFRSGLLSFLFSTISYCLFSNSIVHSSVDWFVGFVFCYFCPL